MELLDWVVMLGTLLAIVVYGVIRTRKINNVQSYLLGDRDLHWSTIGLSVMATQASAITFLSTPGQAYASGMGFAQFYFGLPVAMVLLCIFVLPIYYKLNVYTAYEYLEGRFDLRTRTLTAVLFLIQRGLAAGITIYAPAIILSSILGWSLNLTIILTGFVVIFYTVMGGTKAVSVTQKQQMIVILAGMFIAAAILVYQLPPEIGLGEAVDIAGAMGKLEVVNFDLDLNNRYTFWSGMLGGVFLFLSYFGTDQSQVQRYLSGKSLTESRLGLLFNGIFKVPMQFLVLFVGILVYVFFLFNQPPAHFNTANVLKLTNSEYRADYEDLRADYNGLFEQRRTAVTTLAAANRAGNETASADAAAAIGSIQEEQEVIRRQIDDLIIAVDPDAVTEDRDYVFITFVTNYLPRGLVGLLLAVIFAAAMSSSSSELNALATTTVVDIYRRSLFRHRSDRHYLNASKALTVAWGGIALLFATIASLFDNLIQAVNFIGSLFYGVILGIFVVAFFFKSIGGRAVFIAALITEALVLLTVYLDDIGVLSIAFLWLNLIGCVLAIFIAWVLQQLFNQQGGNGSAGNYPQILDGPEG
ncbi:MAG: sodium:solute symporter [Saprospiraceae bacterium]